MLTFPESCKLGAQLGSEFTALGSNVLLSNLTWSVKSDVRFAVSCYKAPCWRLAGQRAEGQAAKEIREGAYRTLKGLILSRETRLILL